MLQVYLRHELEKIRLNRFTMDETPGIHIERPCWTETKTGLIEILYALDAMHCIDGGNISLSRVTAYVEQMFDVRLGNITRAFNEMKFRNNPTSFLDRMKEALLKKIDDLEEKNVSENLTRKAIENKENK